MGEDSKTHERILQTAQKEFLQKGFQGASLRAIVKEAGVTTGAFYRYYPTKEALFEALVKPHADMIRGFYLESVAKLEQMPPKEQTKAMRRVSENGYNDILDYIYDHYEGVKLLLCSSAGTVYENFVHDLVCLEVDSTYRYIEVLRSMGHPVQEIDRELCHMISSGLFSGTFEVVVHDMDKEGAKKRLAQLREFHTSGWERIMGIKFG